MKERQHLAELRAAVATAQATYDKWERHPKAGRWALHDYEMAKSKLAEAQSALAAALAVEQPSCSHIGCDCPDRN
jgi:hypothetical protein